MQPDIRDKLWAHVHGELTPEERLAVDNALQADVALKAEWLKIRALDRQLREAMGAAGRSEAALADALLEEWERTQGSAAEAPGKRRRRRPAILRIRTWASVLALAAGLVLAFGLQAVVLTPLDWTRTDVLPVRQRGVERPVPDPAAFKAMETLSGSFKVRIAERYARQAPSRWNLLARWKTRHAWVLDRRFQQMAGEAFSVDITARRPGDVSAAHEWQWYFQSADSFQAQMDDLAEAIARDLRALQDGLPLEPKSGAAP